MQLEQVEHRRSEREPHQQIDHGRAHRQAVEKSPEQRDHDQQDPDEHEPECGHAHTLSVRGRLRNVGRPTRACGD